MSQYAYAVLFEFKILPSVFLRLSANEKAFLIASILIHNEDFKRSMSKYDRRE